MQATADPSLEHLVRTWRLPLLTIALRQLSEVDDAEDAVQTVLLRVARRRDLGDIADPGAYLRTAVMNQCRSMLARRRPRLALPKDAESPGDEDAAPREGAEVRALLRDAIRTMPKKDRAAMWLVYVEGVRPLEAAHLLRQNVNTFKSTLARGRRLLRTRLGPVLRKAGYLAV